MHQLPQKHDYIDKDAIIYHFRIAEKSRIILRRQKTASNTVNNLVCVTQSAGRNQFTVAGLQRNECA